MIAAGIDVSARLHPWRWAWGRTTLESTGTVRFFWVGPVTLRIARGAK